MRTTLVAALVAGGLALAGTAALWSLAADAGARKERRLHGIDKREPWTTSRVVGSPDPPPPYTLENAYPDLKFSEPLELSIIPKQDRWVVAERHGKIFTFASDPRKAHKELLLDVRRTVYGVALHPQFPKSPYVYVTSIRSDKDEPDGSRVSRFTVTQLDPPQADPKSEQILLTWPSGGHNGGCLRFGPDGYLYLGTGDGSGIADGLQTGQDLSDLLACLVRIDVDRTDKGKAYHVPEDNPFVKSPFKEKGARPEVYAYGLRQPWKFSFDTVKGDLWVGEVGQDLWESIYKIEKGGNYGWSVREGSHPFRIDRKMGPTPILPPIVEHPHSEFRSLTGGYVYHGKRLPHLKGAYVYGDYDTGRVWMLRLDAKDPKKLAEHRELARSRIRIVAWGQDHEGDVYALDFIGSGIYRLVASPPPPAESRKFPRRLSETGLFASTKDLTPAKGLIPYSVNAELWSDGASKERYLAIPGEGKIEYETVTYPQPAPGSLPGWRFPDNTVLVKTFFLETEPGKKRRLETRLLHVQRVPGTEEVGDQVWYGYTYVWADDQSDALLLDANGLDRKFTVQDARAPGGKREQVWHFPSRTECTMCHTVTAKYALGVNTAQMNRDHDYGGVVANQLATLEHLGLFTKSLPAKPEKLTKLGDPHDASQTLELRARSYLHANCSHCHRKWGGGISDFQLLASQPLAESGVLDTRPGQGTFDLKDPRFLVPGEPDRSLVLHRMRRLGLGRMPHIASNVVDEEGTRLVEEWIRKMPR